MDIMLYLRPWRHLKKVILLIEFSFGAPRLSIQEIGREMPGKACIRSREAAHPSRPEWRMRAVPAPLDTPAAVFGGWLSSA